jgi:hypothetical protein
VNELASESTATVRHRYGDDAAEVARSSMNASTEIESVMIDLTLSVSSRWSAIRLVSTPPCDVLEQSVL